MKMIAAFLLLLIGLGVMVLYFKPKDPLTSVDDVAVYQMKGENSAPIATRLTKQEETNKNTVSSLSRKHAAAQEEVILCSLPKKASDSKVLYKRTMETKSEQ